MTMRHLFHLLPACLLTLPAAAAEGWTGWRVGLDGGYGSGGSEAGVSLGGRWTTESQALRNDVVAGWSTDLDPSGAAFGVHAGYDHQFASGFVLGGEVGYARLDIEDDRRTGARPVPSTPALTYDFRNGVQADDLLLVAVRLGYGWERHLVHLTAGWASVDAEGSAGVVSNGNYRKSGSGSERLNGAAFGLGYAFAFTRAWSAQIEYLHLDLDSLEFATSYDAGSAFVTPAYTERVSQDLDLDLVRVGVDYRF